MSRTRSAASARPAGRMAKVMRRSLEVVLPRPDLGEHFHRPGEGSPRVLLGGGHDLGHVAANERVGRALLGDRRGYRRLAAAALRLLACLALAKPRVAWLDRLREADVRERVLMRAIDAGRLLQAREFRKRDAHLLRRALEEPP